MCVWVILEIWTRATGRSTYLVCWVSRVFLSPGRRTPRPRSPTTTAPSLRVRGTSWRLYLLFDDDDDDARKLGENLFYRKSFSGRKRKYKNNYPAGFWDGAAGPDRRTGATRWRGDETRGELFSKLKKKNQKISKQPPPREFVATRTALGVWVSGARPALGNFNTRGRLGSAYACERHDLDNNRVSVART